MAAMSRQTLNADSFNEVFQAMITLKDEEGRYLRIKPTLLVVPPALRALALEVLEAERLAGGASNINDKATDLLVCPYLL